MNNELEDLKRILDDDEEVRASIKPNKKRFVLINVLTGSLIITIVGGILLLFGILGLLDIIKFTAEDGSSDIGAPIALTIFGCIPLLFALINSIGFAVRYKRCIYVLTNKRLIIRSGFIGVDYKSLELKNIISLDVRVDFLDKLVHPNTGSIIFGSAANSIVNGQNGRNITFAFAHIENPYEEYKKIKASIPEK